MAARDEHIAKYIARHRALFPATPLLLVRCPLLRVALPFLGRRDAQPALPILRALAEPADAAADAAAATHKRPSRPRLLVHVFSNGGISTAVLLARLLLAGPRGRLGAPPYVLVLDSCPGYFRWRNTHRALLSVLPWWASPAVHAAIAIACLQHALRRLPPAQDQNAAAACAPGLSARECRRAYLYGTADDMVDFRDVEDNARRAEQAGLAVHLERFDGATHCAMPRTEPERYWRVLRETWEGRRALHQDGPRRLSLGPSGDAA